MSIDFGMGDLEYDYRPIQIGHSVAYGSPPLQRFPPWFEAVLARRLAAVMSPATRYIL